MTEKMTVSRAEEVRQRRAQRQGRRQKQAGERAYRPLPPVTSRMLPGEARPQKARQDTRRRYNSAVGLSRANLQAPSMPRLNLGSRAISLALVVVIGALGYLLWSAPVFRVADPQINGLSRLDPAEVNSRLGLQGQWVFLLRPAEIATNLRLQFPEISAAQVRVDLPNLVQIDVTERQPVLLWQQGSGYTWIDTDGIAFKPRGDSSGLIPVLASGAPPSGDAAQSDSLTPAPFAAPDLVKTALALAPSLPAGTSLVYDPSYGFGWTDTRGWQVYFGASSQDMPLKLRVYQSLVDWLAGRGITPAFISVVHADAPYYRMAQ